MNSAHVLIVEPDASFRRHLVSALRENRSIPAAAGTMREALSALEAEDFDVVLLALRLPDGDGLEVLPRMLVAHPTTPVIVMTAFHSVPSAVEAMRKGAFDYLPKPFPDDQLIVTVRKAIETRVLRRQVARITHENLSRYGVDAIIGQSPVILALRDQVRRIGESPATTILIQGESGAGKDLVAKAIHYSSADASLPFVPINCSAIPESLLESELFGHERGAFTDAKGLKRGLLELADGGTVFLDEVVEISPGLQVKLLRFLEERSFKRVGGTREIPVEVRVIAATNADLKRAVADERFREDLYYRLAIVPIWVPPLRERVEDLPLLVRHFIDHFNKKFRKRFTDVSPEAMRRLAAHRWPGNVREVKNTIERVMILEQGPLIEPHMLLLGEPSQQLPKENTQPLPATNGVGEDLSLRQLELVAITRALERARGNYSRAAKLLGVSRDTVRYRLRKYGITLETRVVVAGQQDVN